MGDPIAEEARSLLDGHIVLSRKLAEAGKFPAIDVLASRSRVMARVVDAEHAAAAERLRALMSRYDDVELLVRMGEYSHGSDALTDEAIAKKQRIDRFLHHPLDEPENWHAIRDAMIYLATPSS
jgi:type III secretion protein N (ATPase)